MPGTEERTELRDHFNKFHHDYPEEGRVIDSEEYLGLVHTEDHADDQGIRIPHEHEDDNPHIHVWGEVEISHFTGNPHRKCACGMISLDLTDEEPDEEEE